MELKIIDGNYSIIKPPSSNDIPVKVLKSPFFSLTKTDEELSIVCQSEYAIESNDREDNWSLIKVMGPLDFSLTGILSRLASPLAEAEISIFAISTYDTDYLLVKTDKLSDAKLTLEKASFTFIN